MPRKHPWKPDEIAVTMTQAEVSALLDHFDVAPKALAQLLATIRDRANPATVEVCEDCGSPDVDMEAWVRINGEATTGGDPPGGTYCCNCSENDRGTRTVPALKVRIQRTAA